MKQSSEDIVRVGGEIHQEVRRICAGLPASFAAQREKRIAIPIRSLILLLSGNSFAQKVVNARAATEGRPYKKFNVPIIPVAFL